MGEWFDASRPMSFEELYAAAGRLKRAYRSLQCFPIGKSVLGRPITAFVVGSGPPGVLYVGAHHALEYLTAMALTQFAAELCGFLAENACSAALPPGCKEAELAAVLARRSVYIVPMLNPDGVELHLRGLAAAERDPAARERLARVSCGDFSGWQANAHGVDLNHNYNAGWLTLHRMEEASGIRGPAPRQFGGPRPESEPETRALCNLCRRMLFRRVYAFHSQGEEIYWEYGPRTPKNSLSMARALADSCGYAVSEPTGMASHGGFKDWFISVFARPGFTVEIGRGKNPLPPSDLAPVYEKLRGLLYLGLSL